MACCDGKNVLRQTRGDTRKYFFQRLNGEGQPILTRPDKLYFTVKDSPQSQEVAFQKTIDDFTIDEEGFYHFTILPDDTNDLSFKAYVYDIEVIMDDVKTTISKGQFVVEEEVTWADDEV